MLYTECVRLSECTRASIQDITCLFKKVAFDLTQHLTLRVISLHKKYSATRTRVSTDPMSVAHNTQPHAG